MAYFFVKTISPRTTFNQDMSAAERKLMHLHLKILFLLLCIKRIIQVNKTKIKAFYSNSKK